MPRSDVAWYFPAALCLLSFVPTFGQSPPDQSTAVQTAFFSEQLYPIFENVQCNLCHSDNGVASETELEFPGADANQQQIAAFGLQLKEFVDRDDPQQSQLLLKPTNREEHTGGERIKPGSREEAILLQWIESLAGLTEEQVHDADEQIALAQRLGLQSLSLRRLTHSQYNSTVFYLLGEQSQPASNFPQEDFVRGFKNQAEAQGISPLQAEAYAKSAERLAVSAFRGGDRRGLLPRQPNSPLDAQSRDEFVRHFGLRAFRRPLSEREFSVYTELFDQEARRDGDFFSGAKIVVEAMLQSPHFLFRLQRGDGQQRQYEIASRLSYFLWDTMPSEEMFQAAARGEFTQPMALENRARQMLDDPRARVAMDEFLGQWLRFDNVLNATRDRRRYADFNADLAAAMIEETKLLFHHLVWDDGDFMEFFTADYTFLNADLARLYQLQPPAEEFSLIRYPTTSGRSGVLGHGSFLVATSKPAETSPTERGLFIRNHFLGHEVPPPPPGVNTSLPEITDDQPMTNQQRLEIHLNSEACASCHRLIDPIGLGFEDYDAIGSFQASATAGTASDPIARPTAFIQGIENSAFSTPKELGRILAGNEACQRCIVKQLFRYALGREESASDQPVIDVMLDKFRNSGFRFRELVVAMVTSELFLQ